MQEYGRTDKKHTIDISEELITPPPPFFVCLGKVLVWTQNNIRPAACIDVQVMRRAESWAAEQLLPT